MASRPQKITLFLCLLGAPLLTGGSCDDGPDEPPIDCDERFGYEAKGEWRIEADGTRSGCRDAKLNGTMTLEVGPFAVDGRAVATDDPRQGSDDEYGPVADQFADRIERARYELFAGTASPRGLDFSGAVRTCEIEFRVSERLPGGEVHEYTFTGFLENAYDGYGRFRGEGPGSCEVSGEFDLDIR